MKKQVIYMFMMAVGIISPLHADFLVVPVENVIDGGLAAFIERIVTEAEKEQAEGIIFHIDTPGGRIDSAVDIKDTILNAHVPTVAFIDKNAISAGALISLACDSIYMSKGASIGAATAVDLQGQKASEKIISYFRAQMRATAEANGRRPDIAEAMVDEELAIEGVIAKGMLLTLTYTEALKFGISDGTVETIDEVLGILGRKGAPVVRAEPNWAENVVRFLTHPIVSSLLMSIGFLGLIIELKTPGWGIGGTVALIALALFFGSHYIVRLAGAGELLLFTAGIVLLILELFVLPGFGIAGVSGIGLILVSLYLSLVGRIPLVDDFTRAAYTLGLAFVIGVAGIVILLRVLPRTPLYKKLILATVENTKQGFTSAETFADIVGAHGIALSDLHPAGKAEINGRRLDVVTEGGFIEKETPVVVTEVHGSKIVVREA
ncbi:MAG TPA: NfeD family protein [Anaerolineae bacterium]|nr:NfeD family protein [Anaerolineae bacterium]